MQRQDIIAAVGSFLDTDPGNFISADYALEESLVGVRILDEPLLAFGDAKDPYFEKFKEKGVVGPQFKAPTEWLESAATVISIFFPFTPRVREDNRADMGWPSASWLHGRIEGQAMITRLNRHLQETIQQAGYEAMAPLTDPRFKAWEKPAADPENEPEFTSNWSERHAAFVCGLGTFGLSKGLITEKGVAGRFTSVITSLRLPTDTRAYSGIYENCSMCGACAKNCPANAISPETGKDHVKCAEFVDLTAQRCKPRYGCGKCQVKVPCESKACRVAR